MVWVFRRLKGLSFGLAWLDLTGDGPDKAGEFTGDGGDGDLGFLFTRAGEMDVAVVQTALRFPGDVGDGFGQTFLAFLPEWGLTRAGERYCQAAWTRARRAMALPVLVMPPWQRLSPVEFSLGTRPR